MGILSVFFPVSPPDTSVSLAEYPFRLPPVFKLRNVDTVLSALAIGAVISDPDLTRTDTTSRPTYPTPAAAASWFSSAGLLRVATCFPVRGLLGVSSVESSSASSPVVDPDSSCTLVGSVRWGSSNVSSSVLFVADLELSLTSSGDFLYLVFIVWVSSLGRAYPSGGVSFVMSRDSSVPRLSFTRARVAILSADFFVSSTSAFRTESSLFDGVATFLSLVGLVVSWSLSSDTASRSAACVVGSTSSTYSVTFFAPVFSAASSILLVPTMSAEFGIVPPVLVYSSDASLIIPTVSIAVTLSIPADAFGESSFPTFNFPVVAIFVPSFEVLPLSRIFGEPSVSACLLSAVTHDLYKWPSERVYSKSSDTSSVGTVSYGDYSLVYLVLPDATPPD